MNVTTGSIKAWAEAVKEGYLVNKMHPSDLVEEIARANDLNTEQVKRLCQASNLAIKQSLRPNGRHDEVMFPLASYEEVLEKLQPGYELGEDMEVKESSLAPESRMSEFSRHYLLQANRPPMTKQASAPLTSRAMGAIANAIEGRYNTKRRELTLTKMAAEKQFGHILEYLEEEAKVARNINRSYTAAKAIIEDEVVDNIYKVAHRIICDSHTYPYPEPGMLKIASVPNPGSAIVTMITKYAALLAEIETGERDLRILLEQKKVANENLRNTIIGEK